jgi:EpsI family protein
MHMLRSDIRPWIPAAILVMGSVFLLTARSQRAVPLAEPVKGVLTTVSGYRPQDQKISKDELAVAGMTDYMARVFWRDSTPAFSTLVAYYDRQTQGKTIHSPRNCLPGAGWEILTTGTKPIQVAGTNYLVNKNVLKNGASTALVYYWYQGRGRIEANEYRVKWNLLRDAAIAGHTEEALVRVIVPVRRSRDPESARLAMAQADSLGGNIAARLAAEVTRVLPGT